MAKGFISISVSGNGSIAYFAREEECLTWWHSNEAINDVEDLKQLWKQIEQNEKFGNKELGIRGRHDARVRTNYILSMPNELSPQKCVNRVRNIINQTEIKNCTYTIFVHNGEKDGVKNSHVHLIVNERILSTGKKSREMIKKDWFGEKLRPLFIEEFAKERQEAPDLAPRERVAVGLYQSDPIQVKHYIQQLNKQQKQEASFKKMYDETVQKLGYDPLKQNQPAVENKPLIEHITPIPKNKSKIERLREMVIENRRLEMERYQNLRAKAEEQKRENDAQIQNQPAVENKLIVEKQPVVEQEIQIPDYIRGYWLSPKEKETLKRNKYLEGKYEVDREDGKEGVDIGYIGLDENGNLAFLSAITNNVEVPDKIYGNKLSERQLELIKNGYAVKYDGFILQSGDRKDVVIQIKITSTSYKIGISPVKKLTRAEFEKIEAWRNSQQQNTGRNHGPKL